MTEIRGDLRDVRDDMAEHVCTALNGNPIFCERSDMHATELAEYIDEMPEPLRMQMVAILLKAAAAVSDKHLPPNPLRDLINPPKI